MDKKTIIVNYFGLGAGGIEKYICRLMRYSINQGHRVIWFTSKYHFETAEQRDVADNPKIEKIFFHASRVKLFSKSPNLDLKSDENVVMISFIPEDYIWAEQFRLKYQCKSFYHHLILMNFFGWLTYPEDEFKTKYIIERRKKFSYKIAHQLDENNNIRAFDEKQIAAFKDRYGLNVEVSSKNLLKAFPVEDAFTESELWNKAKSRNEEFIIATCARFQFPHKGYILGLLDVFKELKKKHPKVKLVVIGDGERDKFDERFYTLPDEVKKDITLTGTLPFAKLNETYKKCHMCIGLAGAISTSASLGLPSLVTRHDTLECETYGFYQDVDSVLKSDPGVDIVPFIEKTIECSDEDYVKLGLMSIKAYEQRISINPSYILEEVNKTSSPSVTKSDMRVNKLWALVSTVRFVQKKIHKEL